MSIVNAKEMLLKATDGGYAVGAFNITNLIQMEAVIEAAVERSAPLIIQTSVTPSKFLGREVLVAIYRTLAEAAPIPICLHLDHCTDVGYCKDCAAAGYTNIMIDASKQGFEENIRQTREVADYAHGQGDISVEGELGTVAGVEDQVKVVEDETQLADPAAAVEFVERTGIDLFAPAIGTAHGVYKTSDPKVDFDRLAAIRKALETAGLQVPLVVHGGTGLPEHTVKKLLELGGAKFNVSTELKHSLIDATFDYLQANRGEYNPGKIDKAVKVAIKKTVNGWIDRLGCQGEA
ncbi:MAG: class II fructose-bisphosphate aldolase [Spirochaetaceae bacterium]|nr:MAG: class II fructose-bisphosphate aldolase [Spirochaetaceae bacterium]